MLITSLDNKRIKDLVKLRQKKVRDLEGKYLVDSINFIKEAYDLGLLLELYVLEGNDFSFDVETYFVTEKVMNKIKVIDTCKVIGVVKKSNNCMLSGDKILLLDNVQDPGNLGTIIRSSLGFNIDTLVLSDDCCDIYNDKVLRASEGALLKLNIIRDDLFSVIEKLKYLDIPVYVTDVFDGTDIREIPNSKYAVIMGNEGNGVREELISLADKKINIKTNSKLESLNVAIATSIILYELDK